HLSDGPERVTLGGHPALPSNGFLRHSACLRRSDFDQIRSDGRRGRSLPHVAAAAAAIFLHRLTGARDLVFGLLVAARDPVARSIPGMASNVLPLRLSVHPGMTVADIIDQSSLEIGRALEHQLYQIADLRRALGGFIDSRTLFGLNLNVMRFDYN